jgi:uncharacterized protein with FMN-binding domain
MTDDGRKNWMKSNLAALGSAAVLGVYAAGYLRTKPAADLLAEEFDRRRPPPPSPPVLTTGQVDVRTIEKPAAPKPAEKKVKVEPKVVVPDSTPAPVAHDSVVPAPAPVPVVAEPEKPPPPDSAKPAVLKDGLFSGWGTSRHGDIQAYVEIKGGKITSAFISECLTQYSCSWIARLPKQVVDRQSAEVDYVSGATQSANAFYYAIVNALKQAK